MKYRFPGFKKCLEWMRSKDALTREEGFQCLQPHAGEYVQELMAEFEVDENQGLRCWLLELIGDAKSPEAFDLLASELQSSDECMRYWAIRGLKSLNTKQSRKLLFDARLFKFESAEATEQFRRDLKEILGRPDM